MPRAMNDEDRMAAHRVVLALLITELSTHHQGRARGIRCCDLARKLRVPERAVRLLVSEAREEGIAIVATPDTGYYVATTPEELEECCQFLEHRALHSLKLLARLRKTPLAELMGQMRINA